MSVVCFGEILFRFAPDGNSEWLRQKCIPAFIGGAELNVAQALAIWGEKVSYLTALPDNYLSHSLLNNLEEQGINCHKCKLGGDRMGVYYLPMGTDLKSAGVIYDRDASSFSTLEVGDLNWADILEGADWLHLSAISPSLNNNVAMVCKEAAQTAQAKGIHVSIDLNYRSKLWQYGMEPVKVMPDIVKHCDIVMGNLWAVESLLGIPSKVNTSKGKTDIELQEAAAIQIGELKSSYTKIKQVAYTFRLEDRYWSMVAANDEIARSKILMLPEVVDKVGSGDCFMAGLIYGIRQQWSAEATANFAASAAVGKLQEKGDATSQTIDTIMKRLT